MRPARGAGACWPGLPAAFSLAGRRGLGRVLGVFGSELVDGDPGNQPV
jgi:hypothetical protein